MKEILVLDVLEKCEAKLISGNPNDICDNFKIDTRKIERGDTYVGIKGDKIDGNTLFEEALKKGAKNCILQNIVVSKEIIQKYNNRNIIIVKDTIETIGILAKYKRSLFDIPVIGITGSVGKTSTKDIVASIVAKKFNVLKTIGNFNSNIGLPLTVLGLKEEHTAMVVEMGMNHKGEIAYLSKIANPTIAVITNVGSSHIGNLGSRENILKAKLEILEGLKKDGVLIYNNDNDMLNKNVELFRQYKSINFGIENTSDFMAKDIILSTTSSKFKVEIEKKVQQVEVPVAGKHFVYNSLCAIAVGVNLGIDIKDIIAGIMEFNLTKSRMEVKNLNNGVTLINDSYNASYDSMKSALEFLGSFINNTKIAVLGDMLELGEFSDEFHKKVGELICKNNIDILITVGKHSKKIVEGTYNSKISRENVYNVDNNESALKILKEVIVKNSVILIKASNSMNFIEIYNKLISADLDIK